MSPQDHTNLPATISSNGVDTYRMSTDAARICGEIVKATAQTIQGKKYVKVEGWQAIAIAHGCVASSRDVEIIDGGIRAIGEVRRMSDGFVIASAEGFVGDDEQMWAKRPMFARRAMAQTRAISRACRSGFAHVVVMIDKNLSTTPAEEMQGIEESWVDEARKDGLTTGDLRSTHRIAQDKKDDDWCSNAIVFCNNAVDKPALVAWWKANAKKREEMEDKYPDDYRRFIVAYDNAMEAFNAKAI